MRSIGFVLAVVLFVVHLSACASGPKTDLATQVVTLPPPGPILADPPKTLARSAGATQEGTSSPEGEMPKALLEGDGASNGSADPAASSGVYIIEEIEEPEAADETEEPSYDVPIVLNESVEAHLEMFQTVIRERFGLWLSRSGRYLPIMKEIFRSYGLPEDLVFVALIESGFNPAAYSRARAVGPWQFIKGTGRKYGLRIDVWIDERRDPIKSTVAAARYLRDLYQIFDSWPLALASYNAGEGRVMKAIARSGADDYWDLRTTRHLRRETRNYVPKFMAATIIAKNPQRYGFELEMWEPLRYDEVVIDSPTDLRVIAEAAGTTYRDIKELNPELRSTVTPLNYKDYVLKIPFGTREIFLENFAKVPVEKRMIRLRHKVRRGESLSTLARRYGTSIQAIRDLNGLGRSSFIRQGQYLLIPMSSRAVARQRQSTRTTPSNYTPPKAGPELNKFVYKVRRGDTLSRLARRYETSIREIRELNHLGRSHLIRQGEYLFIPMKNGSTGANEGMHLRHRVRRGETLSGLADKYGTSVRAIREINDLRSSHLIRRGQYLLIPVGDTTTALAKTAGGSAPAATDDMNGLQKIVYKVRRGDTLWEISKNFDVSITKIRHWNDLGRRSILKAGDRLVLYVDAEQS